jgi:hypothetical protein
MDLVFREADYAALEAYRRAYVRGAEHETALNIVVSTWFCRCPQIDTRLARRHVSRLLDELHAAARTTERITHGTAIKGRANQSGNRDLASPGCQTGGAVGRRYPDCPDARLFVALSVKALGEDMAFDANQ